MWNKKIKFGLVFFFLAGIYVALAWKFPFKTTNLVSNFEPGPDVFYYSIPAWNWVHGNGFKMEAFGVIKDLGVRPLYGIYLIPFFKAVNDVRVYYYANLILGLISLVLMLLLIKEVFKESKYAYLYSLIIGLFWVTNFYVYNLPSLLMSENLVMPIMILLTWLLARKTGLKNIFGILITIGLLWFSKSSNAPMVGVAALFLIIKIVKDKYFKKSLIIPGTVLVGIMIYLLVTIILPNRMIVLGDGNAWFSIKYFNEHLVNFLRIFIGGPIRYLWYDNQLIDPLLGYLSLAGLGIGLLIKKYRYISVFGVISILVNVIFFAFFYSPEGRYLSTLVPFYLLGIGIFWEFGFKLLKQKFIIVPLMVISFYFLGRVTINGFYERRLTTMKRQVMNNFRQNESPWNYLAVEEYNRYFTIKNDNCYFGSLLNYFYFHLVFNKNCNYLPISEHQDFGSGGMIMDEIKKQSPTLIDYYKNLIKNGKTVYISNYYGSADGGWAADFQNLMNTFEIKKETDGCLGNCSIYRLVKLKQI